MHKVFLFGTRHLSGIPDVIAEHIKAIISQTNGECEFIVGDDSGIDSGFQKLLAGIGASSKTKVFCMNAPRNNLYDLPVLSYQTVYDTDNKKADILKDGEVVLTIDEVTSEELLKADRRYFEFKDKEMSNSCDFAVCFWDKQSKGTMRSIDRLKAQGKYVYIYTADI